MHAIKKLHKILKDKLPFVHKVRLNCLMQVVETLILFNKLALTALGRSLINKASARDNIKKVDRLLKNKHLYKESLYFYKVITELVLKNNLKPWILIDWTCISSARKLYLLRASLAMKGRSIVLFEEVHPKKLENNPKVHKKFLAMLKFILPPNTIPIIVTDAGFRAPWFKAVIALGWHFAGRLRNKNLVQMSGSKEWQLSSSFYANASDTPTYIGNGLLTEQNKVSCNFVIYKEKQKNRKKLNKNRKKLRSGKSIKYARANTEPWIIVTSFEYSMDLAFKIINIYKTRMQIEENIRDTKSQYGFRLNESLTRTKERMSILLLIAAIASLLCWLAGILAKKWRLGPKFQAASAKFTSKLSVVFIGKEALKRKLKMTKKDFLYALKILRSIGLQIPHGAF